jgi:hypothetical protein
MSEVSEVSGESAEAVWDLDRDAKDFGADKGKEMAREGAAWWARSAQRMREIALAKANAGVGFEAELEWGGNEPPKTKLSGGAYFEDGRGNRVTGNISRDDTGRNKATVRGNHGDDNKWERPRK